ncbi:SDR family NAD(P)-dependent oxidoreductase [Ovoidimarina sediminis]|uniref:SDR family NAD(P)-dependent oxidoreductase n=1 Tax=Ovoidimarina sediminis TaxID=3079856 RepID=UPI00291255C6|nr:SDR family oxidoreductase [Rhodophyticola sp. MJ-SS7]MDU8943225.1 SDR family oxidoreductase [Rhodophyticola sp. MJ-SS7]
MADGGAMQHVLVTGGTGGIGSGIAEVLLSRGWQVTVTGATEAEVREAEARWDGRVRVRHMDVTDTASVSEGFRGLERLDGLVTCAGILLKDREWDIDGFEAVIGVNLVGTMRCALAAHPFLAASGGAVVTLGSMYSFFGGPHAPAYSASKGGVVQLTKALAGRWATDGVRVNVIAPGWIETPMTAAIREGADRSREAGIMARTPMDRWGAPREVGQAVAWLLSDEASFVTGTVMPIDGGYSAM